ncbi:hypothetical protein JCM10212_000922 [Sporobolomyces blumeae]
MPLPHEQHAAIEAVLSGLYHLQSPNGPYGRRYYSLIFRDLPDRREYPDYYLFIKDPRSLNGISESLRQGRYKSPQGVAYDLFLIWSNAREYNEQGSQVYADADTLESYMQRLWQERCPPLPPFESLPRPGSLPAAPAPAPAPTPAPESDRKVKRLKLTGASLGSSATKIRLGGPAAPPPAASPPPSIPALTLKLGGRPASSSAAPQVGEPVLPALPATQSPTAPVQPTASTSTQPDIETTDGSSRPRADRSASAAPAKKDSKKKGKQAENDGEGDGDEGLGGASLATVPDPESGWMGNDLGEDPSQRYLEIVNKLRTYSDSTGRQLATPLLDLPDRAARPDYYQLISDPVALSTIDAKIRARQYPTPEAFDRDLMHLFDTAKVFIRPDTPGTLYSDLIVLQRLYQEMTKCGADVSDPDVALAVGNGPGNIKREDGPEHDAKIGRPTTRPTIKDKVLLDSINFKGHVLKVGDWVYLCNSQNPGKPIIAQVWQTYKRTDSAQRCLSVCWYYRPEETIHPASRQFYENEVFKTGIFIDHVIEEFVGRCFVMFFTRYTRGRPRPPAWTPDIPLYVCEFRYKDDVKAFKKIKSWNSCVPEQVRNNEYEFEPYADEHVDVLPKVKSPFVRGMTGPGGLDGSEVVAAQSSYNFSQDGVPTTAEHATQEQQQQPQPPVDQPQSQPQQPQPTEQPVAMDIDVQGSTAATSELARMLEVHAPEPVFEQPPAQALPTGFDASLANLDATALLAPHQNQTYQTPQPATPNELTTTGFFTPLPSSLKSKFRNDALGDLLWFSAPAASPPVVKKPSHSLAYLHWRVKQNEANGESS